MTGFGGRDLSAFSNENNTNSHVVGLDYTAGIWNHQVRFSYVNFNNGIIDANGLAGTPDTLDPNGAPVLVRIRNILQDVGPDLLAPQQTYQDNHQTKYDGSVVLGKHTLRFGGEWNRIDQFVFANFFGLAPRLRGLITDSALAAERAIFRWRREPTKLSGPTDCARQWTWFLQREACARIRPRRLGQ